MCVNQFSSVNLVDIIVYWKKKGDWEKKEKEKKRESLIGFRTFNATDRTVCPARLCCAFCRVDRRVVLIASIISSLFLLFQKQLVSRATAACGAFVFTAGCGSLQVRVKHHPS